MFQHIKFVYTCKCILGDGLAPFSQWSILGFPGRNFDVLVNLFPMLNPTSKFVNSQKYYLLWSPNSFCGASYFGRKRHRPKVKK